VNGYYYTNAPDRKGKEEVEGIGAGLIGTMAPTRLACLAWPAWPGLAHGSVIITAGRRAAPR
jgi:hypothetical protein